MFGSHVNIPFLGVFHTDKLKLAFLNTKIQFCIHFVNVYCILFVKPEVLHTDVFA